MTLDEFQESLFNQLAYIGDKPFRIQVAEGIYQEVVGFELVDHVLWAEMGGNATSDYHQAVDYVELRLHVKTTTVKPHAI